MMDALLTVVEMTPFQARAGKLLAADERQALIETLARDPKQGVLVQGTGGIRKMRFATGDKGKSGGVRVIYYFHSRSFPVFLLTVYAKNEQDNLSQAQRNTLAKLVKTLIPAREGENHE